MLRRYRHKATGALVTASTDLPASGWEPIDGIKPETVDETPQASEPEKPKATRATTRKTTRTARG